MKNSKLITGILAGAAVGAILGVLFAPHKGSKTRQNIKDSSSEFGDNIKNKFSNLGNTIANQYDKMHGETKDIMGKAKDKTNSFKEEVKNSYL